MKNLLFTLALLGGSAFATPTAIIHTTMGDITIELDEDRAPATVANFRRYAENGIAIGIGTAAGVERLPMKRTTA